MMSELCQPLILCMENALGEEVALQIEPDDDFQNFLDKAKSLLGFDVDINSITKDQPVSLNDNIYQFLLTEQSLQTDINPILHGDDTQDLVYILDDGTQIRASQIQFDNDDPLIDLTAVKIPFVKLSDVTDDAENDFDNGEVKKINIVASPVSRWSSNNSSPKGSFANSLPFKLICNNTSGFEAQFTKYLEANCNKTYATLNPVKIRNKSPKSLIKDNFENYDFQRNDNMSYTREDVLNMFKDSPMTSLPYDQGFSERRNIRKTDPARLVYKTWNKPISQICFICGNHVDNAIDKLYLFDNEDQRLHRCSPQKKNSTQLKIICEFCLNDNFRPCRMKSANQFLNKDEFLVIRNNQQYIFQKIKDFTFHHTSKPPEPVNPDKESFSNGETKSKNKDTKSDDVIIVKVDKEGSSSDVEIIEPEPEIDHIIDNLEEADEEVKEFLGKYSCDGVEVTELKCRFCDIIFPRLSEMSDHCETHKHDLEDGEVYPCPLCNYGYANLKWLKGHLKAAHERNNSPKCDTVKEEIINDLEANTPNLSPIAKRTRSASKKNDDDKKDGEKSLEDENIESNVITVSNKECNEVRIIKTEVKQEAIDSSEDEIWIVQTADAEGSQELEKLLAAAKGTDGKDMKSDKLSCIHCRETFTTPKEFTSHQCKRKNRKRKTKDDNAIRIPTEEDFLKRAQGRPRPNSTEKDLLTERTKKRKSKQSWNPRIVTCHNCNESFTSKVRLKFHMQFHDPTPLLSDGVYSCEECPGSSFSSETQLFDHVHFQHAKQKRWQCPVRNCHKTFYLRATLTKHSRTHTDTRRYVCVTCGKRFLDKQTLDEHGVTHLQIKPFQCHICLKQLTRRSRLRMHVRAHEEELSPTLVCVCAVCQRAFRDVTQAQEHTSSSSECLEAFASELKEESEDVSVLLSPTSGVVRHRVHVVESPKLSKPVPREVSPETAEPLLRALADEARALIRVVEIEKAFRCEYCEDVFYTESGLNGHRVIHKGVKNPFTCHICKVSFATYSRCTTHKTTHGFYKRTLPDAKKQIDSSSSKEVISTSASGILGYGDFPVVKHFLCEDCGRSYLHWTYLQVHRRMKHANDNYLHKCNQCEHTFANSWSLAYHRKKVHNSKTNADDPATNKKENNYRIPCRDCEEVLPNKTALYKHRKKEHSDGNISTARTNNIQGASSEETTSHACPHCPVTFRHVNDLHKHVKSSAQRSHGACGVRAWACARCRRRFRHRADLRTHLRIKHPATLLVIEMEGLDPSPDAVTKQLALHSVAHDKVLEITKISFTKGSTSVLPNSTRALSALSDVPRAPVVCHIPTAQTLTTVQDIQPSIRGPGIVRSSVYPKILQRRTHTTPDTTTTAYPLTADRSQQEVSELNVQMLFRDGVLNGNQMVQLRDSLLLDYDNSGSV